MDFRTQKTISITILSAFVVCVLSWYFLLHNGISNNLLSSSQDFEKVIKVEKELKQILDGINAVNNRLSESTKIFHKLLKRIPSIMDQDNSLTLFKEIIQAHSLLVDKFNPSQSTIEEKILSIPKSGEKITIKKYAVDVVLSGDFLSFGYLLDYIQEKSILINLTNIEFLSSNRNNIKFLAYFYFQEGNNNPDLIASADQFIVSDIIQTKNPESESNYIGSITTISWKGEEVVVGIDNPQYTTEGIEIYSIEYSDGRKEFVERSKLPPELFDDFDIDSGDSSDNIQKENEEVIQLKAQLSDQLVQLEERIKSFKTDQIEQQKKHEKELQKVEEEYKKQIGSIQDEFEKQIIRQEKKISAFEEQEKLKEELKKMDKNKLERESKEKIESLEYEFDNQLRKLQSKIISFENLQKKQQEEFTEQKHLAERQNKNKLNTLQKEFETQLNEQQKKIAAFESMQEEQKKEKQNQDITNKENQQKLIEIKREFETQLNEQQKKIAAFESMQIQQQQEMAEKKLLAKQANKEKLAEIQREFVDQLKKKENQIVTMVKKSGGKPIQKKNTEKKKPDLTPADKKAIERKKMKEFMATLKELEAQEKKKKKQKSKPNRTPISPVSLPVRKISPRLEQTPLTVYENLDNVFENMSIDGIYRFKNGNQSLEIIIITSETETVAQIITGYWEKPGKWKNDYRNLTNVRIIGDKLFSSNYNGEFIFYDDKGELKRGLRMEDIWINEKIESDYTIGKRIGSINNYFKGDYPHTSIRVLKNSELENMSSRIELKLMRNEIFARYGYKFEPNGFMDQHFSDKRWYKPQYEDVTSFLTDIEIQNVNKIKGTELEYIEAVNFLKSFAN
tara:strand:- start:117397 stop:119940 length:2544 start_codon:yes stop_codon:yes gene_type:complete